MSWFEAYAHCLTQGLVLASPAGFQPEPGRQPTTNVNEAYEVDYIFNKTWICSHLVFENRLCNFSFEIYDKLNWLVDAHLVWYMSGVALPNGTLLSELVRSGFEVTQPPAERTFQNSCVELRTGSIIKPLLNFISCTASQRRTHFACVSQKETQRMGCPSNWTVATVGSPGRRVDVGKCYNQLVQRQSFTPTISRGTAREPCSFVRAATCLALATISRASGFRK